MFLKKNDIILAPLAGVTDTVFRRISRRMGADVVVSEMVSADGLHYGSDNTASLMRFEECERPIGIQLFGSDPERLAEAARFAYENVRPDFIDLNSGCPVAKVVKRNGGAALMKDPALFGRIVEAMAKAVPIPVTVKIRSGWNKYEWVDVEFAKIAEDCGAAAVTLHPRSQTMMFTGHSFWERIAAVKAAVSIPVIGNGDITGGEAAVRMIRETGCDAVMVGRAAMGDPWIFAEIKAAMQSAGLRDTVSDDGGGDMRDMVSNDRGGDLHDTVSNDRGEDLHDTVSNDRRGELCSPDVGASAYTPPSTQERKSVILEHIREFRAIHGERFAAGEMKKWASWYIKGLPGASAARGRIFGAASSSEIEEIIEEFFIGD